MRRPVRTLVLSLASFTSAFSSALLCSADYSVTDIVDAAKRGDGHAVHKLIELDPDDVNARDHNGYTPLHWAAMRGHWRIVAELVASRAPVDAAAADHSTPLHWACHHDRPDMVTLLLDAGADPNSRDQLGRTPLYPAARRGCDEVAGLLISRGADPDARANDGSTPLHAASRAGHETTVSLLLASGADGEQVDNEGLRPADVALSRPPAIDLDPEMLDSYVGIFDLGGGQTVKISRDGGQLEIRDFAPDLLYPIAKDTFFCRQEPWRVAFGRSEGGEIDRVELKMPQRTVRGTKMPSPHYVGSRACRECHDDGPSGGAWVSWLRSRHSHAYWRLAGDWALFLARLRPHYSDVFDPIGDRRCLLCHVTAQQDDDALLDATFRSEEGIGCEACHGPGSRYIDPNIMRDPDRFRASGGIVPAADTCRMCHRNSDRFDYDTWWPKIAHGTPGLASDGDPNQAQ